MQFLEKEFIGLFNASSAWPGPGEQERSALAADSLRESGRLRLQVRGESMLPVLWPGDVVEIASCSVDEVQPGEIVLAMREGRFFLHRFLARSQPDGFLLRGDSMPGPDPQFPNEALLGRLVSCAGQRQVQSEDQSRDEIEDPVRARPLLPLRPWSRALGQLLCHCGPARRLALRLHDRGKRCPREIQSPAGATGQAAIQLGAARLGAADPGAS
jgi:Peptidase S24-like